MFDIKKNNPVKLFLALTYKDIKFYDCLIEFLKKKYGKIDEMSFEFDFSTFSRYYNAEMGNGLKKRIVSFAEPVSPETIYKQKLFTNRIEYLFADKENGNIKRTINIDPGYLTPAKVVLLTTKNYSHRIYLKKGIYAEITLSYYKKTFNTNEWTYPDYSQEKIISFFNNLRKKIC